MSALSYSERAATGTPRGVLVLHHGRGADEHDLLGLADVFDPDRELHVVAPRAPLTLPGRSGYHWYVVPRVGYPDPTRSPQPTSTPCASRRAVAAHRPGSGADGSRRILDGGRDELRTWPRRRSATASRQSSPCPDSYLPSLAGRRHLLACAGLSVFIGHGSRCSHRGRLRSQGTRQLEAAGAAVDTTNRPGASADGRPARAERAARWTKDARARASLGRRAQTDGILTDAWLHSGSPASNSRVTHFQS